MRGLQKNAKKIFFHGVFFLIQFIHFEMHMDRPDKLKIFLGYNINHLFKHVTIMMSPICRAATLWLISAATMQ